MISIIAQNEYFGALNAMVESGPYNSNIGRLYDEMIAEYQNNKIGMNEDDQNHLFTNLEMRFYKFSGIRIARRQLEKFKYDEFLLKPYPDILKFTKQEKKIGNDKGDAVASKDSLDFIEPGLLGHFEEIENKITGKENNWSDSSIRLAAFCELLYEKKYFTEKPKKRRNLIFINDFAKKRYGKDIGAFLLGSKKTERENHKTKIKNNKPRLDSYFK